MVKETDNKERRKARGLFKRLKAGLTSWEELKEEDIKLLKKYYRWLFRDH